MALSQTRRDFIHDLSFAGAGMIGLGAFLQSCAEKKITYSHDLARIYIEGLQRIIGVIREREISKIEQAVGFAVQAKLQGKKLYTHLIGSMIEGETSEKRPGHPNIFQRSDISKTAREDFVITNEADEARGLTERLVRVVGITSPSVPSAETPPGALENMGSYRMEDIADIVIYSHIPPEDGIVPVKGIDIPLYPSSGIIHTLIYYSFVAEVMEELAKYGVYYSTAT